MDELDHHGREVWRRDYQRKNVSLETAHAEITVSTDSPAFVADGTVGLDVALHEFSRRQGLTVDGVYKLETQFLDRRTADAETRTGLQFQEQIFKTSGRSKMSKEVCRPDNFVDRYMGKIYKHDATEIISMGMEAVFARTQDGLSGVGGKRADPEMRNFVLGMLAGLPGKKLDSKY